MLPKIFFVNNGWRKAFGAFLVLLWLYLLLFTLYGYIQKTQYSFFYIHSCSAPKKRYTLMWNAIYNGYLFAIKRHGAAFGQVWYRTNAAMYYSHCPMYILSEIYQLPPSPSTPRLWESLTIHQYNTPNFMQFWGYLGLFCPTKLFSPKLLRIFASNPCRVIQYLSSDVLIINNFHVLMEILMFTLDPKILYKMAAIFQDGG